MNIKRFFEKNAHGMGYYIALVLCAAAIGTTGYLYYRNANRQTGLSSEERTAEVSSQVAAISTLPGNSSRQETKPEPAKPTEKQPMKTCAPVDGITVAVYAMEELSYNETTRDWRTHNGVDLAADAGTIVRAAADGTVYTVFSDDTMGTTVVIRHEDGYVTKYCSLSDDVPVKAGEQVTMGQTIGYVGESALLETASGAHVHFSVTKDGESVDPASFCKIG